ncbi:spore gernimation protein [Ammoniphilus oxalaticus]|uniref:Spore gernimation protein n=1 Tax=Ammoniphilus oxalaticus TaxID=66863 RepID=A0A419SN19_9BACL|nr:glycoside hydrolase family 18 protein [Ammoniphilus oxalaticus]RKD25675.1 spore gernimation protein [Ammoniphilus oxalaticus]
MQIHVVRTGQSLYTIAQTYQTTVAAIATANQLDPTQTLVVGQALVIPTPAGGYYIVQPGDSLFLIGRRFGIHPRQLAIANQIALTASLAVGQRLLIPKRPKRSIEVNAYVEPRGMAVSEGLQNSASEAAPHLTYLAPFSFQIRRDGSLQAPPLDNLRQIAEEQNVTLMMVITNQENDQFSPELAHLVLTNQQVQDRLLNTITETARRLGFRDIHFDIERLYEYDRESYNQFLRRAADLFHRQGWLISTALAPKTSAGQTGEWYTAHDYAAHGRIVDFSIIMTYEWGWSGGPPMPVSPIGPVEQVLRYALSEMPANKVMMGQNLYGYDWTLPYQPGGAFARALSPQAAIRLAREQQAAIEYDEQAQAPHFTYYDEESKQHQVWFEDARSIQAKFDLVKRLGLRGISYWKLGLSFPQNWLLLEDNFTIAKRS